MLICACGGISKARISNSPSLPLAESGRVEFVDAKLRAMRIACEIYEQVP